MISDFWSFIWFLALISDFYYWFLIFYMISDFFVFNDWFLVKSLISLISRVAVRDFCAWRTPRYWGNCTFQKIQQFNSMNSLYFHHASTSASTRESAPWKWRYSTPDTRWRLHIYRIATCTERSDFNFSCECTCVFFLRFRLLNSFQVIRLLYDLAIIRLR